MVPMFGTQSVTFWYPTSFPQFRTLVRPPNPIPNPKREGGRGESARPSATIVSHPRRLRVTVARPSDGPTDQRRLASERRVAPPRLRGRPICEKQLTTTPLYVGDSYSVGVFVHAATVILWDKVALSAYSESAS